MCGQCGSHGTTNAFRRQRLPRYSRVYDIFVTALPSPSRIDAAAHRTTKPTRPLEEHTT
jgi:hypothetical protein